MHFLNHFGQSYYTFDYQQIICRKITKYNKLFYFKQKVAVFGIL
ncbi:hypothetical protein NU08_2380 [Flavobacterium anhuiense]|uniref:Uncharacterized protein n=1 Tax=Flavobacterium anhuiense TaxID=459526 RepID=A0A444VXW4_9FLAO|nr:hypothetical protein NU08_2380 [Flavobacterium anhuiense]